MSFWNDPGASFEGLAHDPWHSMENFATTGLVPLIPYIGGIVGGIYGGPGGAAAGGAAGQAGVDYFSGNSDAKTGEGIMGSLFSGAGKGSLASGGYNSAGGLEGIQGMFGGGTDVFSSPTLSDTYSSSGLFGGDSSFTTTDATSFGDGWSSAGFNGGDTSSSGFDLQKLNNPATRNLLSEALKGQQGASQQTQQMYSNYKPSDVVRQPAFLGNTAPVDVQDKQTDLAALIKALRG